MVMRPTCIGKFIWRFTEGCFGSLYEYLHKLDIVPKLQWSRFQICCQPRSTPGSLRLEGLAARDGGEASV